jgi:spoIIIJ-associated protein
MTTENLKKIKDIANDFFNRAGIIDFEIKNVEMGGDKSLHLDISIADASSYIGEQGRNIGVFEVALRLIIKKQTGEDVFFHLDINNYRSLKETALRELAKKAAHRARFYKKAVALEAMSAYDRRVIHTELAPHPDIKTESVGEGKERRVVVKYIS